MKKKLLTFGIPLMILIVGIFAFEQFSSDQKTQDVYAQATSLAEIGVKAKSLQSANANEKMLKLNEQRLTEADIVAFTAQEIETVKTKASFSPIEVLFLEDILKGNVFEYDPSVIAPHIMNQIVFDIATKLGMDHIKETEFNLYKTVRKMAKKKLISRTKGDGKTFVTDQ